MDRQLSSSLERQSDRETAIQTDGRMGRDRQIGVEMKGQRCEWIDWPIADGRTDGLTGGPMDRWTVKRLAGQMGQRDGQRGGQRDGRRGCWKDRLAGRQTDGRTDGWTEG